MKRDLSKLGNFVVLTFVLMSSGVVHALGLAGLTSESRLFQPLSARIGLTGIDVTELERLQVRFGTREEYLGIGKQRPGFLSQIELTTRVDEKGKPFIQLRSVRSLNEPVLDLIVNVTSHVGQVGKTFQLLLDPPAWSGQHARTHGSGSADEQLPLQVRPAAGSMRQDLPAPSQIVSDSASTGSELPTTREALIESGLIKGDRYGPVRDGDRLSLIAQRTRLDTSVTINQMMIAYVRMNSSAFDRGNLSGLRQGEILRIPTHDQANALSRSAASEKVVRHFKAWESGTLLSSEIFDEPQRNTLEAQQRTSGALRILAADDANSIASGDKAEVIEASSAAGADTEKLRRQLDSFKAQSDDAKRMIELKEEQIASTESEISSKNSEIAALKQLLALRSEQIQQLELRLGGANIAVAEPTVNDKTLFPLVLALLIGVPGLIGLAWYVYRLCFPREEIPLVPLACDPDSNTSAHERAGSDTFTEAAMTEATRASPFPVEIPVTPGEAEAVDSPMEFDPTVRADEEIVAPKRQLQEEEESEQSPLSQVLPDVTPLVIVDAQSGSDGSEAAIDGVLEEVEVYLAYGLYHQSEELLSAVIETHPEKESYQIKLLETLLFSAKYEDFEVRAKQFRPNLDDKQWSMIKHYAVDSGIRPSFFDENARDFTEWVDECNGDLEFELEQLPTIISGSTLAAIETAEHALTNQDSGLLDLNLGDVDELHSKTGA